MKKLFNKKERVLIKTKVPYLPELIGHGIEYTYKSGCINKKKIWNYCMNYGSWKKNIKNYEMIIIGENYYDFEFSKYIKKKNKDCKVIVFFWNKLVFDSYLNILNDPNVDEFYTFDEEDAEKYKLALNTTFYTKRKKLPRNEIKNDLVFIGRSKDRENNLLKIKKQLEKHDLDLDFNIIKDEKDYIEYDDYLKKVSKAKAILEYNAYDQHGLSLRVMESIFFEKKLITNNKHIKKYKFYNRNNIFIIGEDKWSNVKKFINSKYKKNDKKIIDYYDFDKWILRFK